MEGENQLIKMKSVSNNDNTGGITTTPWIEKVIQTPIVDYRKNGLSLILAPYLINTRKLSYNQAYGIIKDWLKKCALLRTLDFSIDYAVKNAIHNSVKNIYKPMRLDTLKLRNKALYDKLTTYITKI